MATKGYRWYSIGRKQHITTIIFQCGRESVGLRHTHRFQKIEKYHLFMH